MQCLMRIPNKLELLCKQPIYKTICCMLWIIIIMLKITLSSSKQYNYVFIHLPLNQMKLTNPFLTYATPIHYISFLMFYYTLHMLL